MAKTDLRRSRMWRAHWIGVSLDLVGFLGGLTAWLGLALWRNGTARTLLRIAWQGLLAVDGVDWLIGLMVGSVCVVVMAWVWAELMRRTRYLSEEELQEMTTKWVG